MMHRFDFRHAICCCLVTMALPAAIDAQTRRIAVYDFSYTAVKGDVVQVFGSDKPVGEQVANRIIAKLVSNSAVQFDVIDRSQIDNLLKEQNQKFSDRFDPHDAPKLGKLLNVDAIVTGSVDELSSQIKNNRVGIGAVGLGKVQSVADVTVSVRVISTETGRIFIADQIDSHQTYDLGKGGTYKGQGSDNGTITAHPGAVPAEHALQETGDKIAAAIVARASEIPTRSVASASVNTGNPAPKKAPPPAAVNSTPPPTHTPTPASSSVAGLLVGRVDGSKVYITGGQNAGLHVNDTLEVRRVTGTMKDARGNDIQTDERIDTLVVTDVQESFAVAQSTRGAAAGMLAKVGDKLKRIAAPPRGKL